MIPKIIGFNEDSAGYVKVKIRNNHAFSISVQAQAQIIGYTITSSKTFDIAPNTERQVGLFPIFSIGVFASLNELSLGSYSVKVEATYNNQTLSLINETSNAIITARDVIYWGHWNKDSGQWDDLSFTIAGWVTPHVPQVDTLIRVAASYHPDNQLVGYQGTPDPLTGTIAALQVKAIFDALKAAGVTYINSTVSYPNGTQRVKYPAEAIGLLSANCIDGTVLFAAAMENIGLNPYIVVIPGHAFVAWETWDGSNIVDVLETTMINSNTFDEAHAVGLNEYTTELNNNHFADGTSKLIDIQLCRSMGITPLMKRAVK
jgi:hypothetical protein